MEKFSRDLNLEKQMDAYIKGHLNEEQARKLWVALLKRPDYIELLETELGVKAIFEKRSSSNESKTSDSAIIYSLQNSWKWMAAAAVVIIMIISVNIFRLDNNQLLQNLAVEDINLRQNLISSPVTRSGKIKEDPSDSLLNLGFKAAIDGDIKKAVKIYEEVIMKYEESPAAVLAQLNIGMIHYNMGYFEKATHSFQKVLKKATEQPVIKEKAYWLLGNAYIIQNKPVLARKAIQNAYDMNGIYQKPAFRLLQKLDKQIGKIETEENPNIN